MEYRRCGKSGLLLPAVTLGLWHNFGTNDNRENMIDMLSTAFDNGITSFDLANNYGPLPGSAEENFGHLIKTLFASHRDEILVTTKAGHLMWDGPYGDWGSRKHIMASIDQSLRRMQLEYVDIFYTHRPDPYTPLEETMQTLVDIVRSGKALYIGLSKYPADLFRQACIILRQMGRVPIVYQGVYSILSQQEADSVLPSVADEMCGFAAFSPLAQGLLTGKYLNGIPNQSRASSNSPFLTANDITSERVTILKELNSIAEERGQTLAQMAVSWLLRDERVTTVVMGASRATQITDVIGAIDHTTFTEEELRRIDSCCARY